MALIKLEIAIDYPIQWEFNRVFRDLIQNFYDSILSEEFNEKFRYIFELEDNGYHVLMETCQTEFSYEWLTYVGGSTKTESDGEYIGKYGEGFKMAALRIMQMGGMSLTMHSQNWVISPVTYFETIDGHTIPMLGYDYREVQDDGNTRLEIKGVKECHRLVLEEALLDFCYPENKLLGRLIGKGTEWELYERSEIQIPCRQNDTTLKGVLYINNLARGRLDLPIVINYKTKIYYDSRSRETLENYRTIDLLHEVIQKLDSKTSLYLLEMLEKKWNEYPKDANDIYTKYYMVCQLARNVASDEKTAKIFKEKYKELVYIDRKTNDTLHNKVIDETTAWSKNNNTRRVVNPIFRLLGAESLVVEYEQMKNSLYKQPTELENIRADILYSVLGEIIPVRLTDKMPEIVIDEDEKGQFNPLQFAEKNYKRINREKKKKYEIHKLAFRHEDFQDDAYHNSLIKMADALLHVYGTDRSSTLTMLLTHLGQWILEGVDVIEIYENKWKENYALESDLKA